MSTRQNSSAEAAHALACSFLSGPLSVPLLTMLAYSVCAAKKQVDIFKNADIKWKTACPWGEPQVQNIARCEKKKYNWGQIENSCWIQGGNMDDVGLGSGVSRLMKEELFPAAERGLDNRWSSNSNTSKAITDESIGQNARISLCTTCMLSGKSLVGIYLCSGS